MVRYHVLSFIDTLNNVRDTTPPYANTFYAGFWWLMRWYVRLPANDQLHQSNLAKTAARRVHSMSPIYELHHFSLGVRAWHERCNSIMQHQMREIYREAVTNFQVDIEIAIEVERLKQKHHYAREVAKRQMQQQQCCSSSSGSSLLPWLQPSSPPMMSSSSGSNQPPLVQPSDPPMDLVQDEKDKKAKDKKDQAPEEKDKKDKKDKKKRKNGQHMPQQQTKKAKVECTADPMP